MGKKAYRNGIFKGQDQQNALIKTRNAGFKYIPVDKVAELPLEDLQNRVEYYMGIVQGNQSQSMMDAVFGLLSEPRLISDIFAAYRSYVLKLESVSAAKERIRQRQVGDMHAVQKLIQFFGDIDITLLKLHEVSQMYREVWVNE